MSRVHDYVAGEVWTLTPARDFFRDDARAHLDFNVWLTRQRVEVALNRGRLERASALLELHAPCR